MQNAISDSLLATVIINIVFTILGGVLGLGSAYLFYQRGKRLKQPTWAIQRDYWIWRGASRLPKFDMRYNGLPVQNLTVSRICLWNSGREPIRKGDIPHGDPLRIEPVGDTRLLDVEVLGTSHNWIGFSCLPPDDQGIAQIQFEFLDQAQGGVLQVVHTGTWLDDIQIKGTVVGGNPLKRVDIGNLRARSLTIHSLSLLYIPLIIGQVGAAAFLYYFIDVPFIIFFSVFPPFLITWIYLISAYSKTA
jgi:hypothetical protein